MPLYPLVLTTMAGGTLRQYQTIDAVIAAVSGRLAVARLGLACTRCCLDIVHIGTDLSVVPRRDNVSTGQLRMSVLPPQIERKLEWKFAATQVFTAVVGRGKKTVRVFGGSVDETGGFLGIFRAFLPNCFTVKRIFLDHDESFIEYN